VLGRSPVERAQSGAAILLPLLIFAMASWWSWQGVQADARARVERMTAALAEHAQHVFKVQDVLLTAAFQGVRGMPPERIAADRGVNKFLVELAKSKDPVGSVTLIDPQRGRIVARSELTPSPEIDLSDRDYVLAHREKIAGSFISEVSRGRFTGEYGFSISRRDPVSGLVAASRLSTAEFQTFYSQMREGDGDVLNFSRDDGLLLVRVPAPADPVGIRVASSALDMFTRGELKSAILSRSSIDGIMRIVHLRKVPDYPVRVYYGLDYRRIRNRWLGQLLPYGLLTLLATGLLALLSARAIQSNEAHRQAITQSLIADARATQADENSATRQKLALIVDTTADAIVAMDLDGRIASWNHAAETLFGYTAPEAIGQGIGLLIAPLPALPAGESARGLFDLALAGRTVRKDTVRATKDGAVVDVAITAAPITAPNGQVIGTSAIYRDIRDRKYAEILLRSFVEYAPAAIAMFDVEMRFLAASQRWIDDYRLNGKVIVGRTHYEVFPEGPVHWKDIHRRALAGETIKAAEELVEIGGRAPMWLQWEIRPWTSVTGKIEGVVLFTENITARKLVEEKLRGREEWLRVTAQAANIGFSVFDYATQSVRGSPEFFRFFEMAPTDDPMPIRRIRSRYHPDDQALIETDLERSISTGKPLVRDRRIMLADGQIRWVHVVSETRRDKAGKAIARFGATVDITDRKRREEQVKLLLREVDHRGRNLLQLVQAIALQTATSSEEFMPRFLDRIHALAVSQDLVVKNQWRGVMIADLVRSQLGHFEDLLDTRIGLDGPDLQLSPSAAQSIGMALHELATNASKYGALSNSTGRIMINWSKSRDATGERFHMGWRERGGPPVKPPAHQGFGTIVIGMGPQLDLEAEVALDYASTGLAWTIDCPAEKALDARTGSDRTTAIDATAVTG
jgi:PAS domain S-box-containing protein